MKDQKLYKAALDDELKRRNIKVNIKEPTLTKKNSEKNKEKDEEPNPK